MNDGNNEKKVEALASDVSERLRHARAELQQKMDAQGLTAAAGWRIFEDLRHTVEGTQWTFRPMHLKHSFPELFTRVAIDQDGRLVRGD